MATECNHKGCVGRRTCRSEKKRAYDAAYYAAHRDERRAYDAARRDERRAYSVAYRVAHRDERRVYLAARKDELRAYQAARKDERRATEALRRALKRGSARPEDMEALRDIYRTAELSSAFRLAAGLSPTHVDHIHALSKGGSHDSSKPAAPSRGAEPSQER